MTTIPDSPRQMMVTRNRKARWPGVCPSCGKAIVIGQRIAFVAVPPVSWCHAVCVVEWRKLTGGAA